MSPACGHLGETEHEDCARWPGLRDSLAGRALEGADLAEGLADDDDVADAERAGLDDRRGDRAAALVELRLDDRADRGALRVGLQLLEVGHEEDRLEQVGQPDAGLGRHGHERRVAAVLLDDDVGLGQLGLDPVRVGIGLVDLVEGDDDRHLGRPGMVDRLERLGHDPIVGGDHDDRDVGHPGAPGPHRRERLVARRVEEHDAAVAAHDLARADVLGDAAPLAGRDLGRADGVEEARLAMVHVAHDGDDGCPRLEERRIVFLEEHLLRRRIDRLVALGIGSRARGGDGRGLGDLVAELARDEGRGVAVDQLVDGREDAALDELADDVGGVDRQELGQLLDGDRRRQLDGATLTRVHHLDRRPRTRRPGAAACGVRVGRGCRSYSGPLVPPRVSVEVRRPHRRRGTRRTSSERGRSRAREMRFRSSAVRRHGPSTQR